MTQPKILLWDLETTPLVSQNWSRWESNAINVLQESYVLSCAYKWLGDKKTHIIALNDFIGNKPNTNDTKEFIQVIHDVLSSADILVAQNGDSFDLKKINTRFVYYGLSPIPPKKTVDTLKVAKKHFAFSSNSLNELGKYLGLGEKLDTGGFKTWMGCMSGDKKSWKMMKAYNVQDILLLEKVYLRLLPYINNHPPLGMYNGQPNSCPNCGGNRLQSRGVMVTKTCVYQRFNCQSCGSWSRKPKAEQTDKPLIPV